MCDSTMSFVQTIFLFVYFKVSLVPAHEHRLMSFKCKSFCNRKSFFHCQKNLIHCKKGTLLINRLTKVMAYFKKFAEPCHEHAYKNSRNFLLIELYVM